MLCDVAREDDTLARLSREAPPLICELVAVALLGGAHQHPTGHAAVNEPLTLEVVLVPDITDPINAKLPLISDDDEDVIVSVPLVLAYVT